MPFSENTLNAPVHTIELIRGTNRTLLVTVTDEDGEYVDLTGARVVMSVKEEFTDEFPLIFKDTQDPTEAVITSPTKGMVELYIVPSDTKTLSAEYDYIYDVWVIFASGSRSVIIPPSVFKVRESVSTIV